VVCITHYTQEAVRARVPRTWVVPNAVDQSFYSVQSKLNQSEIPTGICVGTICSRKNQNAFIRALDNLATIKQFKIIFAGLPDPGGYGEEFQQLIRERPWCEHVGFLDRENLKVLFKTASFLALPTREDNCPMVVLEAMAAGVPVLASNVGGVPDLIEHEVTGLLCDPEKPETFRMGVTRLLDDRAFAGKLAAQARAQAEQRFHPRMVAQKHLEIYREVIAATKRRG
jgi:glycosyltransferase involved in cell wall biosynthesis